MDANTPEALEAREKELDKTLKYVVGKHLGQYRIEPKPFRLPYIIHPMGVLQQVAQWGVTKIVTWKGALGHDLREDCSLTYDQVKRALGEETADVIEELTFIPNPDSPFSIPQQKAEYMRSFFEKSIHALVIKVADRCCNTLDWLDTDGEYGPKYWKKADELFSAMTTRREEIVRFYGGPEVRGVPPRDEAARKEYDKAKALREKGEIVFTRMCYTRTQIGQMCVR